MTDQLYTGHNRSSLVATLVTRPVTRLFVHFVTALSVVKALLSAIDSLVPAIFYLPIGLYIAINHGQQTNEETSGVRRQ